MRELKTQRKKMIDNHLQNQYWGLIYFFLIFLILCHTLACLWFIIAVLEDFERTGWVMNFGYRDASVWTLYIASFYFILATITTVGYGDLNANTEAEMIFCCVLMVIGVIAYSISISYLSSII